MKKLLLSVAALAALLIGSSAAFAHDPSCQPNAYRYGYSRGYGVGQPYGLYGSYGAFYGPRFSYGYGYGYNPGVTYFNYRPYSSARCACGQYHPHGAHCGHGAHNYRRW